MEQSHEEHIGSKQYVALGQIDKYDRGVAKENPRCRLNTKQELCFLRWDCGIGVGLWYRGEIEELDGAGGTEQKM